MRKGLKVMLASFPLAFFVALLSAVNDGFAVLILIPALCLIAGFVRVLYGAFLEERKERVKRDALQSHTTPPIPWQPAPDNRRPELSPPRVPPIGSFTVNKKTAEVVQPPSVTEHTTRLLDEDADRHR